MVGLGTRWAVGAESPAALPAVVAAAVRGVEEELVADDVETDGWHWTLTWLEGRPVVELEDGTLITYNADADSATIRQDEDPEPDDDY